jgi:hypothetical protein
MSKVNLQWPPLACLERSCCGSCQFLSRLAMSEPPESAQVQLNCGPGTTFPGRAGSYRVSFVVSDCPTACSTTVWSVAQRVTAWSAVPGEDLLAGPASAPPAPADDLVFVVCPESCPHPTLAAAMAAARQTMGPNRPEYAAIIPPAVRNGPPFDPAAASEPVRAHHATPPVPVAQAISNANHARNVLGVPAGHYLPCWCWARADARAVRQRRGDWKRGRNTRLSFPRQMASGPQTRLFYRKTQFVWTRQDCCLLAKRVAKPLRR